MTFSIVATDGVGFGVAVASKFLAVGNFVPEVRPGVGAVATQAHGRYAYRAELLDLVAAGHTPSEAIASASAADAGREMRQLGLVTATGEATYTGSGCTPWAGGVAGHDGPTRWAAQGNILSGARVIDELVRAFRESQGAPLQRRLVAALLAADAAGGDARGRQGAAVIARSPGAGYDGSGVLADLRVDDHPDAVTELARLLDLDELIAGPAQDVSPLQGELAAEVRARLTSLGHPPTDGSSEALDLALARWAGIENLEMRLVPGGIDARVLAWLRSLGDAPR